MAASPKPAARNSRSNSKRRATTGSSNTTRQRRDALISFPMTTAPTTPAAKQTDPYLRAFERFEQAGASRQPSWLFPLRKAGIACFAELGFPTLKHEDWRFTNVAPITKLPFKPVLDDMRDGLGREAFTPLPFARIPGTRIV